MNDCGKKWYAIYVRSKSEKKVAIELEYANIEHYLPIVKVLKTWSDRKKWIEEPLFKSYVFVHIDQKDYYNAINVPNAVKYISFAGKAVVVPPEQIEAIKYFLNEKSPQMIDDVDLQKGMQVEIIVGSMTGLKGELVEVKGKNRVKIRIDVVNKSLTLQIPKSKLRLIG
jgi:transcription antitermination factor NusG